MTTDPASPASADNTPARSGIFDGTGTAQGIFWMVLSTLAFVGITGIVRHLGSDLPAGQSAFIRYAFGLLVLAPALIKLARNPPALDLLKTFTLRGFAHALGVTLWFYAMARIPIAEVTAIGYLTPILVTIGAALFLGEKLRARRVAGVVIGLLGALVILRPGFQEISMGQLAQLGAAPLFAVSYLITKGLTGRAESGAIVAMLTLCCTIFLLPIALLDWQTPDLNDYMWLFICAIVATFGHYAMTRALAAAPISVTQPITFLQLVWASILGIVVFGEAVDPFVIFGGGIIVAAATWIAHREMKARGAATIPPANATKMV